MSKKIDVAKQRNKGLEEAMTPEAEREELIFEFYGQEFTTQKNVPAVVIQKVGALSDNEGDLSASEQINILFYGLKMILQKGDRDRFQQLMEDEGVDTAELMNLFAVLLEELSGTPFESSDSAPTNSKKTSKRSVGTL